MRLTTIFTLLLALTLGTAWAQTKIAGTLECGAPDPTYNIPVGDRPDHAFVISKGKCTWTKGFEMAGIAAKDYEAAMFLEVTGEKVRARSAGFGTMVNGDKAFVTGQGAGTTKAGVTQTAEGTWTYTGGTGKLKGLKGKGTYKGKSAPDGKMVYEIEGEYQLPK